MTILDGLILGTIQGLTEFIPVSSSGHLVVAQNWLGLTASPTFDAMVNLGTFLALVVYFWPRLIEMALRIFRDHDIRLARNIVISAVPVGILGFFFSDFFESAFIQQPLIVAVMLVVVGVLMIVLEKLPHASEVKSAEQLNAKRAGVIGLAQAVSLIPGTSRSGSSMVAARFMGLSYKQAAEYSFMLSIPVMAAVVLRGFIGHEGRDFIANNFGVWAVSNLAAFAFGLFAVSFMLRFLGKGNFAIFGYYRIGLAAVVLITLAFAN